MAINLDERLNKALTFTIGEKDYELAYSDDLVKETSNVMLNLADMQKQAEKISEKDTDEMSIEEQVKYVNNSIDKIHTAYVTALDNILGAGEGKRLYDYYDHSTNRLATILDLLNEELQNAQKKQHANRKQRRQAKYKSNQRD